MINLTVTNSAGTFDLTGLINSLTWSGEYRQGARKLSFGAAASAFDSSVPTVDLAPGGLLQLTEDSAVIFEGLIVSRSRDTGSETVNVTAYDRGFYLLKNQGVYQFKNQTADAVARQICSDFGIKAGNLAPGTAKITRNFIGVTLYKIIMTAYTEQAKADGKAYQIRFRGAALEVVEVGLNEESVVIEGGVNLQGASMQDSIENTVTRAAIYDSDDRLVTAIDNGELQQIYGILQRIVRQKDGEDASAEAKKLLADNGLSQTVTVETLGDTRCLTGSTVAVEEPYTGLYGLFWITSDKHVWKDGKHFMELELSFKRMMDEQEAGSLPTAGSSYGTSDKKVSGDLTQYEAYLNENA